MQDTDCRLAFFLDTDQHTVERHTAHERVCAIDRIQYPATPCTSTHFAKLLAEDSVVRKTHFDDVARNAFALAIRNRDKALVGLDLGCHAGLEMGEGDASGAPCDIDRELQECAGGF